MTTPTQGAATTRCPQCWARVPDIDGPAHPYVPSAPGCWATFTDLQAEQLQRFGFHPAHGLVVDAYMAQHPGDGSDRRDRQSVFVHLVALCAVLERGWPDSRTLLARLTEGVRDFPRLHRPGDPGAVTVTEVVGAQAPDEYTRRARGWADSVWRSWTSEHGRIRDALDELDGPRQSAASGVPSAVSRTVEPFAAIRPRGPAPSRPDRA